MCEANAYIYRQGREELLMEAVDLVEAESDELWRLVSIFGEQKTVRGTMRQMALGSHKLIFNPLE